jgi:hypothetical protein
VLDESDTSGDDQFLESELRDFLLSRFLGEVDSLGIQVSEAKTITVENIAVTPLGDLAVELSSGLTLHSFNSNRGSTAWLLSTDDATYSCSTYDDGMVRFSRLVRPIQPDEVGKSGQ